jgi:hypothetical protein
MTTPYPHGISAAINPTAMTINLARKSFKREIMINLPFGGLGAWLLSTAESFDATPFNSPMYSIRD